MQIQAECKVYHSPVQKVDITIKEKRLLPKDLQNDITLLLANMILEGSGSNVSARWWETKDNSSGAQCISLHKVVNTAPGI